MVWAGTHAASFNKAEQGLQALGELEVSDQRVRRATVGIGDEVVAQRDAEVAQFEAMPIPEQRKSPAAATPKLAVVEMDGGRMQYRDRHAAEEVPEATEVDGRKGRFWRETKVGVLLTGASQVSAEDPCPRIPEAFLDRRKIPRMCREIKGIATAADEATIADEAISVQNGSQRAGQPEPLVRSVVATRRDVHEFGRLLAASAWRRGFYAAERKAFLGDGLEQNWTVWRRHFSDFVPILDFVHALCYVYAAALAGRTFMAGWSVYAQWAQWIWSGRVELVIAALAARKTELGLPAEGEPETSPPCVVADALRYFENQRERMHYDEYRRQGLPLTTAHVESVIKQIGRRVKGTEKFWSAGGEALLALSAAYLSETQPMERFWANRTATRTGHRHYSCAA